MDLVVGEAKAMEANVLRRMHERIIKNFMGILDSCRVEERCHERVRRHCVHSHTFHLLVSSGTVYSLLYSLERDGLIEGQ